MIFEFNHKLKFKCHNEGKPIWPLCSSFKLSLKILLLAPSSCGSRKFCTVESVSWGKPKSCLVQSNIDLFKESLKLEVFYDLCSLYKYKCQHKVFTLSETIPTCATGAKESKPCPGYPFTDRLVLLDCVETGWCRPVGPDNLAAVT